VLGTVFWPWAQVSPLVRPIQALRELDAFPHISTMLYAGGVAQSNALPWHYAPWWFLITTPPVVLAGAALSLLPRGPAQRWRMYAIWGVVLFPIGVAILSHTILYDGIRHLLFVYPPLAVASAAGWAMWLSAPPRAWMRGILSAALIAGLVQVLAFHAQSYPNQAAYFNGLVGGPRGAFARYDMDYWGNCILEGVAWSARTARLSGMPLIVSGDPSHLVELNGERFKELYFVPPYRGTHHLDVRLARGSAEGVTGLATRPDTLYKVQTGDGAVLCVVTPGPKFADVKDALVMPEGPATPAR
jgi:hypothetical protein